MFSALSPQNPYGKHFANVVFSVTLQHLTARVFRSNLKKMTLYPQMQTVHAYSPESDWLVEVMRTKSLLLIESRQRPFDGGARNARGTYRCSVDGAAQHCGSRTPHCDASFLNLAIPSDCLRRFCKRDQ